MENNLYYIPTIEEFHIGFECEVLGIIGTKENERLFSQTTVISQKELPILHLLEIRVKYLDQYDIESLGLNKFKITEYVERSHLEFTWFKGVELFGLLTFTDKMISFYEYNYTTKEYSDCIFRGTIKNKSELIKLMQQLNIK